MGEQDSVTVVALLVSLIALLVTGGQLLQQIFGTAENYRRANEEIIGGFSMTRRRIFHLSELRLETRFMTPHFRFRGANLKSSLPIMDPDWDVQRPSFVFHYQRYGRDELDRWIEEGAGVSRVKRWQHSARPSSSKHWRPALSAGWLTMIDQLFVHQARFRASSKADEHSCIYGNPSMEEMHMPALDLVEWSWDLLPPNIVRPLASINLGDLLLLCYRLRIAVDRDKLGSVEKSFSADGNGHNFSTLNVQGLGLVVQYRFDPPVLEDGTYAARAEFVPSSNADQLAFGIIPENARLGITERWDLGGPNYVDSALALLDRVNIRGPLRDSVAKKQDFDVFNQVLSFLCPFLPIRGLGIVKYVSPLQYGQMNDMFWRENRLVFRLRLNEMVGRVSVPATGIPSLLKNLDEPHVITWVSEAFNFIEALDPKVFPRHECQNMFGDNAHSSASHHRLDRLLDLSDQVDRLLLNLTRKHGSRAYVLLIGAHLDHTFRIKTAIDKLRGEKNEQGFRDGTNASAVRFMAERAHRYVDGIGEVANMAAARIQESAEAVKLEDSTLQADMRKCEWLMILRGCLWEMMHYKVGLSTLPFRSQYYCDTTQVLIA